MIRFAQLVFIPGTFSNWVTVARLMSTGWLVFCELDCPGEVESASVNKIVQVQNAIRLPIPKFCVISLGCDQPRPRFKIYTQLFDKLSQLP